MDRYNFIHRVMIWLMLAVFLQATVMPGISLAQGPDCPYDRANPSLENARISFKSLNYICAEQEILDFLKLETLTTQQRADAHVLLAAVYYAKLKGDEEKREQVIKQFKKAFLAYREWRGELDISSTEFIEMMNEARRQVDEESEEQVTPPVTEPEVEKAVESTVGEAGGKPWYTQWWAIGLGVGVVAGAVILVAGGGGDDDGGTPPVSDTLPNFPGTPSSKK